MFAVYYNGIYVLLALAVLLGFLPNQWARRASLVVAGILGVLFINALTLIPDLAHHTSWLSPAIHYFPSAQLTIQYRLDGLGLLFYSLITGIGCLVFYFAFFYMRGYEQLRSFFAYLTCFAGAMLGIISANNLLLMFIFWELTTITSYLLIGYKHEAQSARDAAMQGLLTTVLGGLAFIAAMGILAVTSATLNINKLLLQPQLLEHSHYLGVIGALFILAAFTKSAQFPFHYWLPGAMEAPTPVSTYLHSATMVTAGVYLLALFHPVLHTLSWWYPTLITIGLATMLTGGWLALRCNDIKLILAYTTVYALGSMVYLLASGKPLALEAMVVFLVVHALYKAALFTLAGFLEKTYNTRDITQIHGLWRSSPLASIVLIINCASMASLPPFFGFFAKQLALESKLAYPDITLLLEIISFLASGLIALQGIRLIVQMLPQRQGELPRLRYPLLIPSIILTLVTVTFSLSPYAWNQLHLGYLASQSITPITHQPSWLALQNYTSLSTLLSAIITLIGLGLFFIYKPLSKLAIGSQLFDIAGPTAWYNYTLIGFRQAGFWVNKHLQNGNLQNYMSILWVFFITILALSLYIYSPALDQMTLPNSYALADIVLTAITLTSAIMAILMRSPITILAALSILGFVSAVIFLIHGAPDVAITQVLVDTLIVILFVINLYRLPTLTIKNQLSPNEHGVSLILAVIAGGIIGLIVYLVAQHPMSTTLSHFYLNNSFHQAHGQNVVNVILVDFRAFDTLGEIIVVMAAAIGILGLITKHGDQSS